MADSLTLRVITPERVVIDTTVSSVKFPGLDGLIGVLPKHAHMVSALDSGLLEWSTGSGAPEDMFVAGGFAEVRGNTVRIVTEAGELATDIEIERAEQAAVRAKERLKTRRVEEGTVEFDVLRAEASLRRALMRTFVAGRAKR
ncbi:MAG: F-type H+-transporting ATPase subunit epsilon [Planctomycetota bacterium]|jgi:F-type H+-transporting ATPase subunit epsilon